MNRILEIGYCLSVPEKGDGCFIIKRILGKGASSVTYLAECNQTEHVLKECNPLGLHMHRDDKGGLVPDTELNKSKFEEYLSRFVEGANKQLAVRLTDDLKNTTSNVQAIYHANNTVYIDMTFFNGRTYDQVEDESLYDLLRRMKALAQIVGHYHDMGYLHLDIKPQNIYAIPETPEMVMMFDFDSVVSEADVEKTVLLSYTDSWAAPEQKMAKYRKSICKATDLFAIGEIIFHRVMGRHSCADERFDFSKYAYDRNAKIFENVNPRVFRALDELFHKTLCCAPANRIQTAEELIVLLDEIIPLADSQKPFLISNLPTPKEFFIGRDTEIKDIHARLQQSPVLFLHGIGGIGKSELAKQYAKTYQSEYDTVIFAPYVTDIVSLIASDNCIQINNFSKGIDEKVEKYYDRKLCTIKELIANNKNRILLVIDNFDTSEDCHLKDIVDIGCRVIITTRVDFSDVYAQMDLNTISNPFAIFNEYYKKPLSDTERDIVNEIIDIVCGHTMTVELLAKQMMAGRISPDKMLNKLKSGGISESGKEKVRSAKDGNLTMQSTFNHIQFLFNLSGLDENEIYVLANLSLVPHTGISAELFSKWCELDDFDIINSLAMEGWIRWDKDKDSISLHPVVGDISMQKCNNDNCLPFLKNVFVCFENDIEHEYFLPIQVRVRENYIQSPNIPILCGIANRVLLAPIENTVVIAILNNMGINSIKTLDNGYFISLNEISNGYSYCGNEGVPKYLNKALSICQTIFGDNSLYVAHILNNLGVFYLYTDRLDVAKGYFEKVLAIYQEKRDDSNVIILRTLFNLAVLSDACHDYESAILRFNQVMQKCKDIYGENSALIAQQLRVISIVYRNNKSYRSATSNAKKSLKIYSKLFGDDSYYAQYLRSIIKNINAIKHQKPVLEIPNSAECYYDYIVSVTNDNLYFKVNDLDQTDKYISTENDYIGTLCFIDDDSYNYDDMIDFAKIF